MFLGARPDAEEALGSSQLQTTPVPTGLPPFPLPQRAYCPTTRPTYSTTLYRRYKIGRLLEWIPRNGRDVLDRFIVCLRRSSREAPGHGELADMLELWLEQLSSSQPPSFVRMRVRGKLLAQEGLPSLRRITSSQWRLRRHQLACRFLGEPLRFRLGDQRNWVTTEEAHICNVHD